MQPLAFDMRRYYRKHAVGETVSATGAVTAEYAVDGPYKIAFRPGGRARTQGESGYTAEQTVMYCIADGLHIFEPGDILTSDPLGQLEQWKIETVKDFPTEQTFYARGLRWPTIGPAWMPSSNAWSRWPTS